jgi:hypothetical protein
MKLSLRAYQICCEIQRVLPYPLSIEDRARMEDVVHDAFVVIVDDIRRATRREFTE